MKKDGVRGISSEENVIRRGEFFPKETGENQKKRIFPKRDRKEPEEGNLSQKRWGDEREVIFSPILAVEDAVIDVSSPFMSTDVAEVVEGGVDDSRVVSVEMGSDLIARGRVDEVVPEYASVRRGDSQDSMDP